MSLGSNIESSANICVVSVLKHRSSPPSRPSSGSMPAARRRGSASSDIRCPNLLRKDGSAGAEAEAQIGPCVSCAHTGWDTELVLELAHFILGYAEVRHEISLDVFAYCSKRLLKENDDKEVCARYVLDDIRRIIGRRRIRDACILVVPEIVMPGIYLVAYCRGVG